ncbi:MAG: TIGR04255 family protein [Chloroflexota bacterium]|nr:TIGR04255 family protein [Chloroflexota bacterium]
MEFPPTDRVIYNINPLRLVVCQLRFPLDLRIDVAMPADFQQKIRGVFPLAKEDTDESSYFVPDDVARHFPNEMLEALSTRINRRYLFQSRDKAWAVTLANNFVALECTEYICWEDFRERLALVVSAICETYQVGFFTRIGLRYQNVIDRRVLGLNDFGWKELLSHFVLGPLSLSKSVESAQEHNGSFLTQLYNSEDVVRVRYGLVTEKSGDPSNVMFILDYDFFTKDNVETEADDVVKRVDIYNSSNRGLFRRCIKDKLHDAMEPRPAAD